MAFIYSCAVIRKPPTHPTATTPTPTEALAPALRETPSNKELQQAARRLFWASAHKAAMVSSLVLGFVLGCYGVPRVEEQSGHVRAL